MDKHIRCAECRFVRPDLKASDREWTAFECGNYDSEYYRGLLNITLDGDKQEQITWTGCKHGEPVDGGVA